MKSPRALLSVFLPFLIAMAGLGLWAATQNAVVIGFVLDQTGAPVPNATVRLLNAGTGFSRQQATDNYGSYTFTNVPPAPNYTLIVEKGGFATGIRSSVAVSVGASKQVVPAFFLQPAAQPGQPSEQKETEERTVSAELVSNTLGGVIDSRTLRTLPLPNRDFLDLALLIPGAYPVEQGSVLEGASLVVDGTRAAMNNFLLDGADNNDYTINQSLPFQIVEALQEFRVQTSTSTAEFGRTAGAQINSVSRSGANDVHGGLFYFHRNSKLSADNFFSAMTGGTFDEWSRELVRLGVGNPQDDPTLAALFNERNPNVVLNQFGANIGGALAKDRLFGFFNWESFRVSNPRPVFERVPGLVYRDATVFNPMAAGLYNLYPEPNVPTTAFTDPDVSAFFVGESENRTETDNFLTRIDWRLNDSASMSFKHNIQEIDQIQGGSIPANPRYPGNGTGIDGRNQNFSYNYVHQLTANWGNEFRFGWNRFRLDSQALDASINPATLGFQNLNFTNKGLPTITIGGAFATISPFAQLGANPAVPGQRVNNVWSWADNMAYTRGNHILKFGAEYRHVRLNVLNEALGRGLLTFYSESFVAVTGLPDIASIARVSSEFGGGFDRSFGTDSFNWYVQDQWKIHRNFTLNYGVRYEFNSAPVESRDRLVNFFPEFGGLVRVNTSDVVDPFGTAFDTTGGTVPRAGIHNDSNNLAPRIGFAWDPRGNGKTVLRGGYVLVYDQQPLEPSVTMLHNPPFVLEDFSFFPFFAIEDTFTATALGSGWDQLPYSTVARDPRTRTTYVHQANLALQQQLGDRALFEVAYVGSGGHKLPRLRDISDCTAEVFLNDPFPCFDFVTNPFLFSSILNQENSANSNFHSLQLRFETRNLRGLTFSLHYLWAKSIDTASSLQPQVFITSPFIASFLTVDSFINPDNFAGANSISPSLSLRPTLPVITTRPRLPQDSSNIRGERGRSDFDIRHRFVLNYIYDIPRFARGIGEGWQLAGITTIQSGAPYSVFSDFFGIPLRPNLRNPVPIDNNNPEGAIDNAAVLNSPESSFGLGSNFDLLPGDLGRNTFSGPSLVNFDFSILKNTYVGEGERVNFQFRVEFFNIFNTTNFYQPYSQGGLVFSDLFGNFGGVPGAGFFIPDASFGHILQARDARRIQFAFKVVF